MLDNSHSQSEPENSASFSKAQNDDLSFQFAPSMDHMLCVLRQNKLNWFSFVEELKDIIQRYTPDTLNQILTGFSVYLSTSDVTSDEEKLIKESRQAFMETERQQCIDEVDDDIVYSDDETNSINPDEWLSITGLDSAAAKEMIVKQRKIYKRKVRTRAIKAKTEARLLKKRLPKRVSTILTKYPNIG